MYLQSDQMRQDVSDYKMQLQSQRDNLLMRKGEDVEVRDKMKNKNKELAGAMEELQVSVYYKVFSFCLLG